MTYAITAPILYKEVVINNLSAFMNGIDDIRRPYHPQPEHQRPPDGQSGICAHVVRGAGHEDPVKQTPTAYACPRHRHDIDAELFHKHELIGMVGAIHVVYCNLDKTVYHDVANVIDEQDETTALQALDSHPAAERYRSAPADRSVGFETGFKRLTVGSWMADAWNERYGSMVFGWERHWDQTLELQCFESNLCFEAVDLVADSICRSVVKGPLALYPTYRDCGLFINDLTLHNPLLSELGSILAAGTDNIIHISDPGERSECSSAFEVLFDGKEHIARGLAHAKDRWTDNDMEGWEDLLELTTVTFYLTVTLYLQKTRSVSTLEHDLNCEPNSQEVLNAAWMVVDRAMELEGEEVANFWVDRISYE